MSEIAWIDADGEIQNILAYYNLRIKIQFSDITFANKTVPDQQVPDEVF